VQRLLDEARLAKAIHDQLEVDRVLAGQHFATVFQGIVGVDAEHLVPFLACIREASFDGGTRPWYILP
jgi:hypothetical protein